MNFKASLSFQKIYSQINTSSEQMDLDLLLLFPGKIGKIDLSEVIKAEVIFPSKMNFCPAIPCSQPIAFNYRKVDNSFLEAHICSSLDENIALDITEASKTGAWIAFLVRKSQKRNDKNQACY